MHQARRRLSLLAEDTPIVSFSVGISSLLPGSDAEAALRAADESMHRAKDARHRYARSSLRLAASSQARS